MKKIAIILATVLASTLLLSSAGFAAGFRLPEQGAAAMGMSSAFVGQADDPSAVWFNPAGITQLDGTRIAAGGVAVYPVFTHENTNGTTDVSERDIHIPVYLYATHKMDDKISLGLGINGPFGLATDWAATSATSTVATFSKIVTTEVNPNIAYKINNDLSVAFGIAFVHLRATLEKLLPPALGSPNFRLAGDGDGWGANAAIHYKASDKLNAGLSYRSRVKVDIDGSADINAFGFSNSARTDITLPDLMQLGVSYKASDNLTLNADLDYTWWSTYDRIVVQSNTVSALNALIGNPPSDTSTDEKQWKDVWALRIGGQYKLSDQLKLRAGYLYDNNPVTEERFDTVVPDSDRQALSIGAGYTVNKVTIDASYMYIWFKDRNIQNSLASGSTPVTALDGTYKSSINAVALMVSYKF